MHRCKIRFWARRSTNAYIHCSNAGFLLKASMQNKMMSQKKPQCLHLMQQCRVSIDHRCKIRFWARRSTNAYIQCRNAGFLSMHRFKIRLWAWRNTNACIQCKKCRVLIEYIDARNDSEPEEAQMLALNTGMQGFYWMHRRKIRLWARRSTDARIHCRNAGFLLNASIQDKINSQKKHQCLRPMQERRVHIECIDAR